MPAAPTARDLYPVRWDTLLSSRRCRRRGRAARHARRQHLHALVKRAHGSSTTVNSWFRSHQRAGHSPRTRCSPTAPPIRLRSVASPTTRPRRPAGAAKLRVQRLHRGRRARRLRPSPASSARWRQQPRPSRRWPGTLQQLAATRSRWQPAAGASPAAATTNLRQDVDGMTRWPTSASARWCSRPRPAVCSSTACSSTRRAPSPGGQPSAPARIRLVAGAGATARRWRRRPTARRAVVGRAAPTAGALRRWCRRAASSGSVTPRRRHGADAAHGHAGWRPFGQHAAGRPGGAGSGHAIADDKQARQSRAPLQRVAPGAMAAARWPAASR